MHAIDFANTSPVMVLDMDTEEGGDVLERFQPFTTGRMRDFTEEKVVAILPPEFFTGGGLTLDEYLERTSTHSEAAALAENQCFRGTWRTMPEGGGDEAGMTVRLDARGDAVAGRIWLPEGPEEGYTLDHIRMMGKQLAFTFRTRREVLVEMTASVTGGKMTARLAGIEDHLGNYDFTRESGP
jgi:choloylglycine hydrolase